MANIKITNLSKSFDNKTVLLDINLDISVGESLAIVGGSGQGKSVLIKCLLGLLVPDPNSSIVIDELDVSSQHISKRPSKIIDKFSMLFQGNALFDSFTIWENVAFSLLHNKNHTHSTARSIALEKLNMVELEGSIADLYPSEISGGMQKRVALARAITTNPEAIILDEPTSGLDPVTGEVINSLIYRLIKDLDVSVITVTHDSNYVRSVANRVISIENGSIAWDGSVKDAEKQESSKFLNKFMKL